MELGAAGAEGPIRIERWPTEAPLLVLTASAAAVLWVLIAVTLIGAVYALLLGLFFFLAHVGFIAHVRGNGVRLGPDQFPDLHRRVEELSRRLGLKRPPDAYLLQAGGALNALATRFLRSDFIILFSDLLEACGEDEQARDMILAHELGHLKAGHLRAQWLLLPGYLVPFLGTAYSRAREYTADRYGAALCRDRVAALGGLAVLAAGGPHGRRVNLTALARQREDLDTGWMTVGRWLATHPPLADRIAALEPTLAAGTRPRVRGPLRAIALLGALMVVPLLLAAALAAWFIPRAQRALQQAAAAGAAAGGGRGGPEEESAAMSEAEVRRAREEAQLEILAVAAFVDEYLEKYRVLPPDPAALDKGWGALRPGQELPRDPFDGKWYGYEVAGREYYLWSSGPDVVSGEDDIVYDSVTRSFR